MHTIGLQVKNESRYAHSCCRAIKEASAHNKMEIDWKERRLEPSGPRSADKVAWVVWLHDHHMMTTRPQKVAESPRLWGCAPTKGLALICDEMKGDHRAWSGVVRANQGGMQSMAGSEWSEPGKDRVEAMSGT